MRRDKQDVLEGSSQLFQKTKIAREEYMLMHMKSNKYVSQYLECNSLDDAVAKQSIRYAKYRESWDNTVTSLSNSAFDLHHNESPLCIDLEVAASCDLACPHCYRQYIATPDKIISKSLAFSVINQASKLNVPSMKFNWRGEPLMCQELESYIDCAKQNGVLETIINTNATLLDEKRAKKLIQSGLDFLIFSFDGGSKESYEANRPGRFRANTFDAVYENIKTFSRVKSELGSPFPLTKIQMILTDTTFHEQQSFFELFSPYVDIVTVTQYSERGLNSSDLTVDQLVKYKSICEVNHLPADSPYLRQSDGNIKVSSGRKPCAQPSQRMLVTYDGRVAMCCYDWGAMKPIGYLSDDCFDDKNYDKYSVLSNIKEDRSAFQLMKNATLPPDFVSAPLKVSSLSEIWNGSFVNSVRCKHSSLELQSVDICSSCSFKDTYNWQN